MCGRTACTLDRDQTRQACTFTNRQGRRVTPRWHNPGGSSSSNHGNTGKQQQQSHDHLQGRNRKRKYYPSFNVMPTSVTPVLVSAKHFNSEASSDDRQLTPMQWGLVPSWHKGHDPMALGFKMNNCRREGMMEKPSFRRPAEKGQRCVVVVDGYYEWLTSKDGKTKQPYFIYFPQDSRPIESIASNPAPAATDQLEPVDFLPEEEVTEGSAWKGHRLLTLAGLFDRWCPPEGGDPLYTYTVITLAASSSMSWLHHRVPAILDNDEAVRDWLDYGAVPTNKALDLIRAETTLASHPVSMQVNNSRYKGSDCVMPIDLQKPVKETASSKLMSTWLTKAAKPSTNNNATEIKPHIKEEIKQGLTLASTKPGSSPRKQEQKSSPKKRTAMTAWLSKANPDMKFEVKNEPSKEGSPSKKKAKIY